MMYKSLMTVYIAIQDYMPNHIHNRAIWLSTSSFHQKRIEAQPNLIKGEEDFYLCFHLLCKDLVP